MTAPKIAETPRAFAGLYESHRYKVYHGGRGSGKSWQFARALLLMGASPVPLLPTLSLCGPLRVLCARELQASLAESVHRVVADQQEQLGLGYKVEKARIFNDLGTEFFFEGIRHNTDKIKSYEGIDVCWLEEGQRATRSSFEILTPTIRKPGSEVWISYNPDLESDYIHDRFVKNPTPGVDALVQKVNWSDNPYFPVELHREMEELKLRDFDAYLHVWEGHCKTILAGAVYADELRVVVQDHRLCKVPYDPAFPVETFWDLGWADSTAIWFAQRVGFEYRIIEYYENQLKGLDFYLDVLQQRPYIYDTFWLPHDAAAKSLGSGRSIQQLMIAKGKPVRIVPKLSLRDGINAARTIFPMCYFDEQKCAAGIKALRHYRYEVVEEADGRLSKEPVHDWSSHGADAFRYLALALKSPRKVSKLGRGPSQDGLEAPGRIPLVPFRRAMPKSLGWLR